MYKGEIISLSVAVSWTITAICFEIAGKRIGALALNIIRLGFSIVMLGMTLWIFTGQIILLDAGRNAWIWLAVSGLIGYVLGDYCLFSSYILIGSRFGQLFMTLTPPAAALAGFLILGEKMNLYALAGMFITLSGICLSIIGKSSKENSKWQLKLPRKGVLFGIGAGVGQGVGLVFSKLGMDYYIMDTVPKSTIESFMIPFAATQIRAIIGFLGFLLIILWKRQQDVLWKSFRNREAMVSTTGGTFFGPFLGVSFSLMAVQFTEAGVVSTLMALTPILILLPSRFFFKQNITVKEIVGAFISVIGVSLFFI